jgi:hypothetical protein
VARAAASIEVPPGESLHGSGSYEPRRPENQVLYGVLLEHLETLIAETRDGDEDQGNDTQRGCRGCTGGGRTAME